MPIPSRKINPMYRMNKLIRIKFDTLKGIFIFNFPGNGIRLNISCIAPIGHTQPQNSLLPNKVKMMIDNSNEKKIRGMVFPA